MAFFLSLCTRGEADAQRGEVARFGKGQSRDQTPRFFHRKGRRSARWALGKRSQRQIKKRREPDAVNFISF